MGQHRLRVAFYRGGTSKAAVFNGADLPADKALRDRIFLHIMGSPDRYGRQLDGLGGGLSSLSKIVIVEPSARADADVDYTFVQVAVQEPVADYGSACGNMASCVGPFAVSEGMVKPDGASALVRIHSTNTGKIYHATFDLEDGLPLEEGSFEIPGVSQSGARVSLDFLNPGGAITGALLPTGQPQEVLRVDGLGEVRVSIVDAANPVVWVRAEDFGCTATEMPQALDDNRALFAKLETIRQFGSVLMGLSPDAKSTPLSNPKIAMIAPPTDFAALDGQRHGPEDHHINIRLISMGNFHRAITLTGAMCAAVAARIPGTLLHDITGDVEELRIGNPSGVLPVAADVALDGDQVVAHSATTYRTQRRIMEGAVLYPARFLTD